jgi:hypothetical protein
LKKSTNFTNAPKEFLTQIKVIRKIVCKTRSSSPSLRIWQDPLIESIRKAEDRLTNSTNFLRFLGNQALNERDDLPQLSEAEIAADQYHFMSLFLNLLNTFFYMVSS